MIRSVCVDISLFSRLAALIDRSIDGGVCSRFKKFFLGVRPPNLVFSVLTAKNSPVRWLVRDTLFSPLYLGYCRYHHHLLVLYLHRPYLYLHHMQGCPFILFVHCSALVVGVKCHMRFTYSV